MSDITIIYQTLLEDINIGDKVTVSFKKLMKNINSDKQFQVINIKTEILEDTNGKSGYTTIKLGNIVKEK